MSDELSVVNEGLIRLGVPPLASLADQSAQAVSADRIYKTTREAALAEHPWSFAYREVSLPQLVIDNDDFRNSKFDYAYQLPNDMIRVLGLRSLGHYRIAGDQLYANDKNARLVYVADVGEPHWPGYFVKMVALSFASAVAITLTDNSERANLMAALAGEQRRSARAIDSSQTPPYVFDLMRVYLRRTSNPLTNA